MILKLMNFPYIGKILFYFIIKFGGGYEKSRLIRQYFKKYHKTDVDLYTYGGCFSKIFNLGGAVTVGRYCSIASNVRYFGANHPIKSVCMSPFFYSKAYGFDVKDVERKKLIIGNDVWIGYGVIITNKCTKIGNGAVIGAGAVVTKDIPPYAIVAGNPAKILKYRFSKENIEILEKSRWWEKTPEELYKYYGWINDPVQWGNHILVGDKNESEN